MVDESTGSRDTAETAETAPAAPSTPPAAPPAAPRPGTDSTNAETVETLLGHGPGAGGLGVELDLDPLDDPLDDDDNAYEVAAYRRGVPVLAIILFVLSFAGVVTGAVLISGNEAWQEDLECFLTSDIKKCKMIPVEREQARWRKEDAATRPKYGDLTLCYSPKNARVTIEQIVVRQTGWNGPMGEPQTTEIDNKSKHLEENEIVDQIPLRDLPIRQREQDEAGEITEVTHYTYRIRIEREGYEPRERLIEPREWAKPGPDVNHMVPWRCTAQGDTQGACCDLVPKPEFFREPFTKAKRAIHCARQYFETTGQAGGMTDADLAAQIKVIQVQHGFKAADEFQRFESILTADLEWWTPVWEQITTEECPPPEPATP